MNPTDLGGLSLSSNTTIPFAILFWSNAHALKSTGWTDVAFAKRYLCSLEDVSIDFVIH